MEDERVGEDAAVPCKKRVQIYTWLKKYVVIVEERPPLRVFSPWTLFMAMKLESWSMQETMLMFASPQLKTVTHFFRSGFVPDLIGGKTLLLSAHYLDEHVKSN